NSSSSSSSGGSGSSSGNTTSAAQETAETLRNPTANSTAGSSSWPQPTNTKNCALRSDGGTFPYSVGGDCSQQNIVREGGSL
ncbi:hypothetical protein SK128_025123, partial [Halocaridina rubra]